MYLFIVHSAHFVHTRNFIMRRLSFSRFICVSPEQFTGLLKLRLLYLGNNRLMIIHYDLEIMLTSIRISGHNYLFSPPNKLAIRFRLKLN
jgi:hypothetical protein